MLFNDFSIRTLFHLLKTLTFSQVTLEKKWLDCSDVLNFISMKAGAFFLLVDSLQRVRLKKLTKYFSKLQTDLLFIVSSRKLDDSRVSLCLYLIRSLDNTNSISSGNPFLVKFFFNFTLPKKFKELYIVHISYNMKRFSKLKMLRSALEVTW